MTRGISALAVVALLSLALGASGEPMPPAQTEPFLVHPVGRVHKGESGTTIEIAPRYQDGLLGLEGFSHVWVIWWFDRNDNPEERSVLRVHPRGNPKNPLTGVFATRSPARPNLIAMTLCRVESIEGNTITVERIDAFDGTPVLDLKPYIPGSDGDHRALVPAWIRDE